MSFSAPAALEDALRQIAGDDAAPASMTIDYGSASGPFVARAWIERSTRSLVFAQAEARTDDGELIAAASAVFRKVTPA